MSKRGRNIKQTMALRSAEKMGLRPSNKSRFIYRVTEFGAAIAIADERFLRGQPGGYIVPTVYTDAVVKLTGLRYRA